MIVLLALASAAFLATAAFAVAAAPEFLLRQPEKGVLPGSGAGEFDNPRAVAGSPTTGHIYVADRRNARISEYTAWGLFVKAWGWDVAPEGAAGDTAADRLETCGPAVPEAIPPAALCQKGLIGEGPGQMALLAGGIAVDGAGNIWVGDLENGRVQAFNPSGDFLLMFGAEVNRTKVEEGAPLSAQNVCPLTPTDVCQRGVVGEGPGQLSHVLGDVIAYSPAMNTITVGGQDRIQVFDLDGSFKEEIPFEGELAALEGKGVSGLDIDSAGDLYFILSGMEGVYKLGATGEPLALGGPLEPAFEVEDPTAVTVDIPGNVYVIDDPFGVGGGNEGRVLGFIASGQIFIPTQEETEAGRFFPYVPFLGPTLTGLATNLCAESAAPGNLYIASFSFAEVASVDVYGTPPIGCEPPPLAPPEVQAQYASSVGTDSALVNAQINPRFWADTTYYVEYGPEKCSEGGCMARQPLLSGRLLTERVVNAGVLTGGVRLSGLSADTTYHFRFVAQSNGGGPVYGGDPDGAGPEDPSLTEGLEGTFHTFRLPRTDRQCANDAITGGLSGRLPDCRAYELVSPLDKGNADVGLFREERFIELNQAAKSGEAFTFSSITSFADPLGAPYTSQYLARRDSEAGWSTTSIAAPHTTPPLDANSGLNNEFKAFASDLCTAWFRHNSSAILMQGAVQEYPNLYKRDNCTAPTTYEAITTVEPPKRAPSEYGQLTLRGFSDDGAHTVFTVDDKLLPDAPSLEPEEALLYERFGDELRFVCYLPGGGSSPKACSAGTLAGISGPDLSSLHNAVSADGSRIFWTAYSGATSSKFSHPGAIYVRVDGRDTAAISPSVTSEPAFFWTAADDGSRAIFEIMAGPQKGDLFEIDVDKALAKEAGAAHLIAKGVEGPLGASEDATRLYFASTEVLAPGGVKGAHNLYFYQADGQGEGEETTFIMQLADEDIGAFGVTVLGPQRPIHRLPAGRGASVSTNGRYATFVSAVSPTPVGYVNLDVVSAKPDAEVYRFDAKSGELLCVSCNPTDARPSGVNIANAWIAARLQGWEMAFHEPRVLSEDGNRIYFESHEALVPGDTNDAWDVYQWEASGAGTCSEDDATFGERAGGCVDLISSGESPADSIFLDADSTGEDVFIGTQSSLVGSDYGLNDVYDVRAGGGFPERPEIHEDCGSCRLPAGPPSAPTPPSASEKPGNLVPGRQRPCPKKGMRRVRRKGKVRCIRRKNAQRSPDRGNQRSGR